MTRSVRHKSFDTQRRHLAETDKLTRYAVLVTMLMMGFSLAVPVQAQTTSSFTPLSSIPGLTPPETATGITVQTLCPKLSPNVTTGGVGDLQIRCTEMIGNALAGNTSAAVILTHSPEIVALGEE